MTGPEHTDQPIKGYIEATVDSFPLSLYGYSDGGDSSDYFTVPAAGGAGWDYVSWNEFEWERASDNFVNIGRQFKDNLSGRRVSVKLYYNDAEAKQVVGITVAHIPKGGGRT